MNLSFYCEIGGGEILKRKSLIKLISFVLVCLAVAVIIFVITFNQYKASNNRIKVTVEHYEVPDFNWSMEVSTSDGSMNLSEISAVLGELTNEDGTGEINLNMTWEEIAAVLDEKGIPYEQKGSDGMEYILAANGNSYGLFQWSFRLAQLKSGVKISDPMTKATETYGEPDMVRLWGLSDNLYYYTYDMGRFFCEAKKEDMTVILKFEVIDGTITQIDLFLLDDLQAEEFWNDDNQ